MSYRYILRKYKLPTAHESRYQAMKSWREILESSDAEEILIDEFAIDDQPKSNGWFGALRRQLLG